MLPIVLLSTLVASAAAAAGNYTLPQNFNIGEVNSATLGSWCVAERNSCPKICGGVSKANSCDPKTLDFTCTCSNGTEANVALYQETVPFFVCQESYGQCIQRSSSLDDEEKCKEARNDCGSLNASAPSTVSSSTSSATSLPTSTSTSSSSSDDEETTTSATATSSSASSSSTDNAAVRVAQDHATGLLATVLFVGLGLAL